MKFWDTSALVPLVVDEPATADLRALLLRDRHVIVWMLTSVELLSTLGRLGRLSTDLADVVPGVRLDAMDLFQRWATVTHLGAALMASGDRPETLDIVTLDRNLARAAQLEGFRTLPAGRS